MLIAQQETSIKAYHAHRDSGKMGMQHCRILAFLRCVCGDWSIGELAHELRMEKSTVSARVNELLTIGEVIAAPKRKDRISGITVRPIKLSPAQKEMFE